MKTVLCFFIFVAGASCVYIEDGVPEKERITQGKFTQIEDVPYQAKILVCGAVIIDKLWVLTCYHCIEDEANVVVETGTSYKNVSGTQHKVSIMIKHPDYNIRNDDNDVALIKLEEPIIFSKVQRPIQIASSTDIPREGQRMLVSGYGKTEARQESSTVLRSAHVTVGNTEKCAKAYAPKPITESKFCAGDGHADACTGDSGGPAVIDGKLYGIVSGGIGCGSKSYPGIYGRVHKYHDWIVNVTGLDL